MSTSYTCANRNVKRTSLNGLNKRNKMEIKGSIFGYFFRLFLFVDCDLYLYSRSKKVTFYPPSTSLSSFLPPSLFNIMSFITSCYYKHIYPEFDILYFLKHLSLLSYMSNWNKTGPQGRLQEFFGRGQQHLKISKIC